MMSTVILILLFVAVICTGYMPVLRWKNILPFGLLRLITSLLFGSVISITLIYLITCILPPVGDRISVVTAIYSLLVIGYVVLRKKIVGLMFTDEIKELGKERFDIALFLLLLVFAFWLMFKSFRMGPGSTLLIGSNEVFDFGHAISIVRSISKGNNIPYLSPFVAGAVDVYHFMFFFCVGVLEHLGLPLVWAFNLPSAFTYAGLLLIVYYIPRTILKSGKVGGLLAVLFTVMHATLTFIFFFMKFGISINTLKILWHLPKYFFAGPFDGSPVSIYWTLNVFVNQRHLALGIAMTLLFGIILFQLTKRKSLKAVDIGVIGIMTGLLAFWHIVMFGITVVTVSVILFAFKKYRYLSFFLLTSAACSLPAEVTWVRAALVYTEPAVRASIPIVATRHISIFLYILYNYGLLLFTVPVGFFILPKNVRKYFGVGILIFVLGIFAKIIFGFDIDQKFGNYTVIFTNVISSFLVIYLWKKKSLLLRTGVVFIVTSLVLSGVIDLMVIKNDFAYPVVDAPTNLFINWIVKNTSPDAVFVSPPDIFDQVTIAGRRNFSGFFRNRLGPDRRNLVKEIYERPESVNTLIKNSTIDYIVVLKKRLPDFPYKIDSDSLRMIYKHEYENDSVLVLSVR